MKNLETTLTSLIIIGTLAFVVGCGDSQKTQTSGTEGSRAKTAELSNDQGHSGHGAGPHDGTLADWGGGKYHVEFTVDHNKQEATVFILGDDEKIPSPIEAKEIHLSIIDPVMQVTLEAAPQEGDPEGTASRFVGNHESLGVVQEYAGTMTGVIDGTPYSGDFKEEAHGQGGHSHSHGDDDALVWRGEPRTYAGLEIQLGHHGKQLHAGEEVEPAVSITHDGQPVSDAKVFNSLLSADDKTVLAEEVATIFEPTTEEEPAHYAQGTLSIPKGVDKVVIRFRIAPVVGDAVTFDVPVAVE